ncbi:DMT family transporter [candidate division KSB1 bacterium]
MKREALPVVDALLLFVAIIWAFNFTVVKLALNNFPPLAFNTLRFICSSLFFAVYYHIFIKDYEFIKKYFWRLIFLSLIGNTILQILFIEGINYTTASNSSLMYATVPIFVAILSVILKHEKVKILTWSGIIVSFIGIFFVVSNGSNGLDLSGDHFRGDILILITAFCWSAFTVFAKPLIDETSAVKVVAVTFVFGTIFLIPFGIPDFVTMDWGIITWNDWGYLFFSFFFANVIAYLVWFYSVAKVGNVQTAIFQNMVPILAVIIAAVFLNEKLTFIQLMGGIGIVAGVTVTRLSRAFMKNGNHNKLKILNKF